MKLALLCLLLTGCGTFDSDEFCVLSVKVNEHHARCAAWEIPRAR